MIGRSTYAADNPDLPAFNIKEAESDLKNMILNHRGGSIHKLSGRNNKKFV